MQRKGSTGENMEEWMGATLSCSAQLRESLLVLYVSKA